MEMEPPTGTIVFSTVGRTEYGFDVFSLQLPSSFSSSSSSSFDEEDNNYNSSSDSSFTENRLTDGISINYNAQFVHDHRTLVYVSERSGAPRLYLNRPVDGSTPPNPYHLPTPPPPPHQESLFLDRPIITNGRLFFISAHQHPPLHQSFKSWSSLYSTELILGGGGNDESTIARLTPLGSVDYSPAISQSGKFIAVASYGSRPWGGEFHHLQTDIVVFRESDPTDRTVVCQHGGWPTWSGDSTIYFHRRADDGWWSIFRIDLPEDFDPLHGLPHPMAPIRVTPPGLHSFTPAAMHHRNQIAVATRRRDTKFRHIEVFDVDSRKFHPVTKLLNPNFHHYNPFVSPNSSHLGYHRFRGESAPGESTIPHLDPVTSPIKPLRMLRINGSFPSFSPAGDLIAFNPDLDSNPGVHIVKSDGSRRWSLVRGRVAFCNSWSPTESSVIYTSIGPIFQDVKATVQIARLSFDPAYLDRDDAEDIPVDVKILTSEDSGNNAFPSCSPDGKSVVFRSGRSGHKNLYILDAVNGEFNGGIRQLTDGAWIDTMPSWSPDGELIAFSSNRHNPENVAAFSIYLIRPDGTGVRRVNVAGGAEVDRERINHVCFSADSEWLVFAANLGGVTAEPVSLPNQFQPYGELYVVRLDGSGLRRLTWNGYENGTPAWHPAELDMGRRLVCGEKLRGQFDEPLWIQFHHSS